MFLRSLSLIGFQALLLSHYPVTASPHPKELEQRQTCTNSATDRACWGYYDLTTNWYTTVPDTGVTREVKLQPSCKDFAKLFSIG